MSKKRERNSFLTPLVLEEMPSGKQWRLHYSFIYVWRRRGIVLHIRAGLVTDLASIPRLARLFITKLGLYNKAAVVHDAIYQNRYGETKLTRADADLCFYDAMTDKGVVKWKRTVLYYSVRMFGWLSWYNVGRG